MAFVDVRRKGFLSRTCSDECVVAYFTHPFESYAFAGVKEQKFKGNSLFRWEVDHLFEIVQLLRRNLGERSCDLAE